MIRAETLFTSGLKFPDDGTNLKIRFTYNDGYADLDTWLWLKPPDDPRGKLVICPRCQGAVRLIDRVPKSNRGLCCQGCKSRLTHAENERFDRRTGGLMKARAKNAQKPVNQPASKPGRGKPISLPAKPTPKRRRTPARKAA